MLHLTNRIDADVLATVGDPGESQNALKVFERWLRELEEDPPPAEQPVAHNCEMLSDLLALSPVERDVLTLYAATVNDAGVGECLRARWARADEDPRRMVAVVLSRPRARIADALRPSGTLLRARVLQPERYRGHVPFKLASALDQTIQLAHADVDSMTSPIVRAAPPTALTLDDFEHLGADRDLMVDVTRSALTRGTRGVNILVHGATGAGKTEFARAVAKHLGAQLFEVADQDVDGDPMTSRARASAVAIGQRMLERAGKRVLVFDEAEDFFPQVERASLQGKSWVHSLLGTNLVPTWWLTNRADQIDPATLRRFDLVVQFRPLPTRAKERLITQRLKRFRPDPGWVREMAASDRLAPGHIDKMARLASALGSRSRDDREALLSRAMESTLSLSGAAPAKPARGVDAEITYDLSVVNASLDLESVARSLGLQQRATVLLHGAPGTGKTAFVRHLANRTGRTLLAARASELLGPLVSQTERNLAQLFRGADAERSLVFLDEADTYLQNRQRADKVWEVSQVNELLVQMEAYRGVFIAATNLIESLDPACMRRFALKIRFDPMTAEQRWAMFQSIATGPIGNPEGVRAELAGMVDLTPGDFATVVSRARMLGDELDAKGLLAGLADECGHRRRHGQRVAGFSRRA